MPVRIARVVRWGVAAATGVILGLLAHRVIPISAGPSAAHAQAARLLGCYSVQLGEFADRVEQFSQRSFADTEGLRQASVPLKPGIVGTNQSYTALHQARLPLTMDLLAPSAHDPGADALICAMQRANDYQWEALRPLLNRAVVKLIAASRQETLDPPTLADVRSEQQNLWKDLGARLRQGAKEFSQAGLTDPCRSRDQTASPPSR